MTGKRVPGYEHSQEDTVPLGGADYDQTDSMNRPSFLLRLAQAHFYSREVRLV